MLTAKPGESLRDLKNRMTRTNDEDGTYIHLHLAGNPATTPAITPRQRSNDYDDPNIYPLSAPSSSKNAATTDQQQRTIIGTLQKPGENEHYEFGSNDESGEITIILVKDNPDDRFTPVEGEGEGQEYRQTSDHVHRLHATNGEKRLQAMNRANRDYWKRNK